MTINEWQIFWWPMAAAAVTAWVTAPLVIKWYRRRGWVDDPAHKTQAKVIHTEAVPRGGGLVIMAAVLAGMAMFLGWDKHSIGIGLGVLVLGLTGWWDDIADINPYLRLGLGLLAAGLVVAAGIGIAYVTNPMGEGVIHLSQPQIPFYLWGKLRTIWIWSDLVALIWIVWCMNMLNWSKGLDGQLPGVVVIAAVVIGILSLRYVEDVTQWAVVALSGITAGAYLGFLPFNYFPQKMMPGYGGGALAGFLLAVLSILSGAKLATLIIVLGVPMMDAVLVILRRIKHGKSPVWGDRSHLHHTLLDWGWSKKKVAWFYWGVTLGLGIIALQLNARQKAITILLIILGVGALIVWAKAYITSLKRPDRGNG